ncbi:hypothetical protein ACFL2B_00490 [Patescibacteria group bacterium]
MNKTSLIMILAALIVVAIGIVWIVIAGQNETTQVENTELPVTITPSPTPTATPSSRELPPTEEIPEEETELLL